MGAIAIQPRTSKAHCILDPAGKHTTAVSFTEAREHANTTCDHPNHRPAAAAAADCDLPRRRESHHVFTADSTIVVARCRCQAPLCLTRVPIRTLPRCNFRHDMHRPEAVPGMQKIVRTAEQADVPNFAAAEPREGFDVVELEKRPRSTAPPIRRNKGAAATIPTVSVSPHRQRYVTPTFACLRCAGTVRRGLDRR